MNFNEFPRGFTWTLEFEESLMGRGWLDQQSPVSAAPENVVQSLETCFGVTPIDLSIPGALLFVEIAVTILA